MAIRNLAVSLVLLACLGAFAEAYPYLSEQENVVLENQYDDVQTAQENVELENQYDDVQTAQDSGFVSVYLFDPVNNKYLSRVLRNGQHNIEAAKSSPDVFCIFQMYVLGNNVVAFKADNGNFLSRLLFGSSAISEGNYIQAAKSTADYFSQFQYSFQFATPPAGRPRSIGTIALKSDNGRYWLTRSTGGINYIKPLSESPVFYELIIAQ